MFFVCFFSLVRVRAQDINDAGAGFSMPAEWEKHESVWVGWELFPPFYQSSLNVIRALLPHVKVNVMTESAFSAQVAKEYLHMQGLDSSLPTFHIVRDNRIWVRDHGATFLRSGGRKAVADFHWTHYGIRDWLKWNMRDTTRLQNTYENILRKTGSVDSLMSVLTGAERIGTIVSMEGGSLEVNGKGLLILCEAVVFQRNPGLTKDFLEEEFKRLMGVQKIIWMKRGLADDPHIIRPITGRYIGVGTGGHTDEFVRFVNDSTVLLAWVEEEEAVRHPVSKMNAERMRENRAILEKATTVDGRPLRIILFPLPDPIEKNVRVVSMQKNEMDDNILEAWLSSSSGFRNGDPVIRVAAASYLNYFVTNGLVLLPSYTAHGSSAAKEEKVRQIMAAAFPGRRLAFIDVIGLNYEGGGIHCITQQEPGLQ
jgi:agmatine deiminase